MSASNLALGISVALNAGLVVLLVAAHRQEAGLSQTGAFREQVAPPAAQQLASSLSPRSEAKRPTSGKRPPGANADTMHADDAATLRRCARRSQRCGKRAFRKRPSKRLPLPWRITRSGGAPAECSG
jgi:hypothetical protein